MKFLPTITMTKKIFNSPNWNNLIILSFKMPKKIKPHWSSLSLIRPKALLGIITPRLIFLSTKRISISKKNLTYLKKSRRNRALLKGLERKSYQTSLLKSLERGQVLLIQETRLSLGKKEISLKNLKDKSNMKRKKLKNRPLKIQYKTGKARKLQG